MIKNEIRKDEMLFYLEEMVIMDLADNVEERAYELMMNGRRVSDKAAKYIGKRMNKWYNVKF